MLSKIVKGDEWEPFDKRVHSKLGAFMELYFDREGRAIKIIVNGSEFECSGLDSAMDILKEIVKGEIYGICDESEDRQAQSPIQA